MLYLTLDSYDDRLPERVSWEKSFSMKVVGALKYSVKSSVVGGGESRVKL